MFGGVLNVVGDVADADADADAVDASLLSRLSMEKLADVG